ncbi:hypothetical protein KKH05_01975 [Patescibacteria group bacterium]|nr:hypothetical protein [Patescibacteria group bacterium]
MKSEQGKKILEFLSDATMTSAQLFVAIMEAGYGASHNQIMYKLDEVQRRGGRGVKKPKELKRRRAGFNSLLYRLKKQGLIEQKEGKWRTTNQGKNTLNDKNYYEKEADNILKMVTFDIPEEIASQRSWLRSALKNLGFKLLQQSVWVGKVKLPERFLSELKKRHLLEYVEILSVVKGGSLKDIE